jgi:energy-coupling factor transporter ATP-binding protein EcfA2
VFRAGDPVDRNQEAFVPRYGVLSEIDRQVVQATHCPGLVIYGRRRMGKSTLLRNLEGFLPASVQVVNLSMQSAAAFSSLTSLVGLISERISTALPVMPGTGSAPVDLAGLDTFLGAADAILGDAEQRLVIAIDEYENLDRKIGEGVLSEDLLAVVRESIQSHRRLIWAFAGSHRIDELSCAPWTSYLVSARTVEVPMLSFEETRLLLTEPLRHSSLWSRDDPSRPAFEPGFWGDGGIEAIFDATAGWPHLVQLVAETVVDLVNDAGRARADTELLANAFDKAVVRGDVVLRELIDRESTLPGELDYLHAFGRSDSQPPPPDDIEIERSLRRRQLIVDDGDSRRLRVPLMGRWIRQRG